MLAFERDSKSCLVEGFDLFVNRIYSTISWSFGELLYERIGLSFILKNGYMKKKNTNDDYKENKSVSIQALYISIT